MKLFHIIDEGESYLITARTPQEALDFIKEKKQKACNFKK